jgi:hypothetical protein
MSESKINEGEIAARFNDMIRYWDFSGLLEEPARLRQVVLDVAAGRADNDALFAAVTRVTGSHGPGRGDLYRQCLEAIRGTS